jgi:PIN domain
MNYKLHLTVVYDACVLYPAPLRDVLMRLALTDVYHARWSNQIHEEWIRNLLLVRPDLTLEQLHRTKELMNSHVRDSVVTGFEHLIPSLHLPDFGDRHVLAAAIHCGAQVILTFNLKDFPNDVLHPYGLMAQHPDDFLLHLLITHRSSVLTAMAQHRRALKNPPKTVNEYLDTLSAQGLSASAAFIRQWSASI